MLPFSKLASYDVHNFFDTSDFVLIGLSTKNLNPLFHDEDPKFAPEARITGCPPGWPWTGGAGACDATSEIISISSLFPAPPLGARPKISYSNAFEVLGREEVPGREKIVTLSAPAFDDG
jgi:hypothetical protein